MPPDVASGTQVLNDGEVPKNAALMRTVLGHLVSNARAHGATKIILTYADDNLMVSDDGLEVSKGNRARIFDPFFTTRRDAGGAGMGLPIVCRLLAAQGAGLRLR